MSILGINSSWRTSINNGQVQRPQTVEHPHLRCDLNTRHLIKDTVDKAGVIRHNISSDQLKNNTHSASGGVEWEFADKSATLGALAGDRRC